MSLSYIPSAESDVPPPPRSKKYYFVAYSVQFSTHTGNYNTVTDMHPLDWMLNRNAETGRTQRHAVLDWKDIDEATFKTYQHRL